MEDRPMGGEALDFQGVIGSAGAADYGAGAGHPRASFIRAGRVFF